MRYRSLKTTNFATKTLHIALIQAFLLTNLTFASNEVSETHEEIKTSALAVDSLAIPRDFGTIKERCRGAADRFVLYIQDAHCNYEAQTNIANILEHLIKKYSVNFVAVEGADGIVDTSWFKAFPDSDIKQEVADYFMKKGEITGAEYLSITSDYPFTIYGAEDRKYYIDNLNSFLESYPYKQEFLNYYTNVKSSLHRLKKYIYTKELMDIDAKIIAHKEKEMKFADYVRYLDSMAKAYQVKIEDYKNIKVLLNALKYEKGIDFDIVNDERALLIDELSKKLKEDKLEELVDRSLNFKMGKIDANEFYTYLAEKARENEISLADGYNNLARYIMYTRIYSKIENEPLFYEIDGLVMAIKEKMFKNDDQRELDSLWRNVIITLGFMNIELTNTEYEHYLKNKADFSPDKFMAFINDQSSRYGLNYRIDIPADHLNKVFDRLIDFYEIAIKRDKVLVENMFKGMNGQKTDVGVLITGGFHTKGITELLKEEDVSYVVISPSITKDVESPYLAVLTGQKTPFEELIVGAENAQLAAPSVFCQDMWEEIQKRKPELRNYKAAVVPETGMDREEAFIKEFAQKLMTSYVKVFTSKREVKLRDDLLDVLRKIKGEREQLTGGYDRYYDQLVDEISPKAFHDIYQQLHRPVLIPGMPGTPGQGHIRINTVNTQLTKLEHEAINMAIEATLRKMTGTDAGPKTENIRGVDETGGRFILLDGEIYDEELTKACAKLKIEKPPVDVLGHPGTNKTRTTLPAGRKPTLREYEDHVIRSYYIRKADYEKLSDHERLIWARHEEAHIRIALGLDSVPRGMTEEEYVNSKPESDIREILASKFDSVDYMVELLADDTRYGDSIHKFVTIGVPVVREEIKQLRARNEDGKANEKEETLNDEIRKVWNRRYNIELAKKQLRLQPGEEYTGYDIIITSSPSAEIAKYQGEALEHAFAGVRTSNDTLGNKVCVLSVVENAYGGQLIGQVITWMEAREAYRGWAGANGVKVTDLDKIFQGGLAKIAIVHNGGHGSRLSPANKSLRNDKAAQLLVGRNYARDGVALEADLMQLSVMCANPMAISNDGTRLDTFWNTIFEASNNPWDMPRANYHLDKMFIAIPKSDEIRLYLKNDMLGDSIAWKKLMLDLYNYGTCILNENGSVRKFLANKKLTMRDPETGDFVPNPEFEEDLKALLEAALEDRGLMDYGSFSMSRDMHYAVMDYWSWIMDLETLLEKNEGKSPIHRDIDHALIQIMVAISNGLIGQEGSIDELIPEDLATLEAENAPSYGEGSERKMVLLDGLYNSLLTLIPEEYKGVLAKFYKTDADGKADIEANRPIYETLEMMLLNRGVFVSDGKLSENIGSVNLGVGSHWLIFKWLLLDVTNNKFRMLADIGGKNLTLMSSGELILTDAGEEDKMLAEDIRAMGNITSDAVCVFKHGKTGKIVKLSLEDVRKGVAIDGVYVENAVVQGNTVLMPGSSIVNSVVNNSQGKIHSANSYIESSTAPIITAEESVIYRAIDKEQIAGGKQIVADAYRSGINDKRFEEKGHTRMTAPVGHDPKPGYHKPPERIEVSVPSGVYTFKFELDPEEVYRPDEGDTYHIRLENYEGDLTIINLETLIGKFTRAKSRPGDRELPAENTVYFSADKVHENARLVQDAYEFLQEFDNSVGPAVDKLTHVVPAMEAYYADHETGEFLTGARSDYVRFGDNEFAFVQVAEMPSSKVGNDAIENALRADVLEQMEVNTDGFDEVYNIAAVPERFEQKSPGTRTVRKGDAADKPKRARMTRITPLAVQAYRSQVDATGTKETTNADAEELKRRVSEGLPVEVKGTDTLTLGLGSGDLVLGALPVFFDTKKVLGEDVIKELPSNDLVSKAGRKELEKAVGISESPVMENPESYENASLERSAFSVTAVADDVITGRYDIRHRRSVKADNFAMNQAQTLWVARGGVEFRSESGSRIELLEGKRYLIPATAGRFTLRNVGESNAVVFTRQKPAGALATVVKVHSRLISRFKGDLEGKTLDIICPDELVKGATERKAITEFLVKRYGLKEGGIAFKTFSAATADGLTSKKFKGLRDDALRVVIATKANFRYVEKHGQNQLIMGILEKASKLAVDSTKTFQNDKFFNIEMMAAGAAAAAVKMEGKGADAHVAEQDMAVLTDVFSQLTRTAVSEEDVYCIMPYNKVDHIIAGIAEIDGLFGVIRRIQSILMRMPIVPEDVQDKIKMRRRVLISL